MSIAENAARLALIAGDQGVAGALQAAEAALNEQVLTTLIATTGGIASDTGSAATTLGSGSEEAVEVQSAGEYAANAVEDAIAMVQKAVTAVQQAAESNQVFRQVIRDAASRHGG